MTFSLRAILAAAFAALVLATAGLMAWGAPPEPQAASSLLLRAGLPLALAAGGAGWVLGVWIGAPLEALGRMGDAAPRGRLDAAPGAGRYREASDLASGLSRVLGALREAYTDSEIAYGRAEAAAEALRAGEAKLQVALDAAELGTFELDLASGQGGWDERVAVIAGVRSEGPDPFARWLDRVHPEDRDRVEAAQREAVRTGDGALVEYRIRRPDGTIRHLAARAVVAQGRDGPGRLVGFVQDITARKLAAAAVEASEDRYRTLADALPQKVWVTDPGGSATYFNRAMLDYHGELGSDPRDRFAHVHPEDLPRAGALRDAAYEAQTPFEAEIRLRRRDGAYRWHRVAMVPLLRGEELQGWLGTSLDIHAGREAEAALRESEVRLHSLADNLPDSMLFQLGESPDGGLVYLQVGANCERLNGVSTADALADPERLMGRLYAEDRIILQRSLEHARDEGRGFNVEVRARAPRGGSRWLQVSAAPRRLADGSTVWDGVETDITIHKQAELALQSLLADMTDGLRRREEVLAETNVRIRNALQVVLSLLRLQASGLPGEDARRAFATALERVRAIADAHHRLLAVPQGGVVDAGSFVRDLCRDIEQPGVAIRVAAGQVPVEPDRLLPLGLVVNELTRNAARHARQGGGEAQIDVELRSDGPAFSLRVADGGPGLPPGFDAGRGDGLGLRIVRGLVDQLQGRLAWGPGEDGAGAAFTVTAPRQAPPDPALVLQ